MKHGGRLGLPPGVAAGLLCDVEGAKGPRDIIATAPVRVGGQAATRRQPVALPFWRALRDLVR